MKKILVFTAGFGEGHNTAARNIRDAIEMVAPDEARVEILDLFDECYGKFNDWMRKAYLTAINRAPRVWGKIYDLMDNTGVVKQNLSMLKKMRGTMSDLLLRVQPDAVVSTYPAYNYLIDSIFQEGRQRQFSQITVVTDSITINSVWHRCGSDYFLVPNEPTAEVMIRAGVEEERIKVFGFPVTPQFCDPQMQGQRLPPSAQEPRRVLYMVNSGKKEAHRIVRKLLKEPSLHLTVTAGRDTALRQRIDHEIKDHCDRASVLGWTNKMPELLMSHHLVISKAGGATVQEAIAARTPMIISQVVPGQEEGNARLLLEQQAAILAPDADAVVDAVQDIFAKDNRAWHGFYEQISKLSRPSASLDIARFILEKALPDNTPPRTLPAFDRQQEGSASSQSGLLLCDLHTHTVFSDGKLTVGELVDFYGQRGFDALCITDHFCDPKKTLGRLVNLTGLVLQPDQVEEYFEVIQQEAERAMRRYGMIVMTGLEFNKDGLTKKTSAHLLAIDLKKPIDPSLSIVDTISAIHEQGALAVASHPHEFQSAWGKDTLYFWENIEKYAPLLDAWEVANRDDIFNPVGLKRLPFLANSDFHKPKHIYSWKSLLYCEKNPEAIKQCIRINRDVAITLYREPRTGFGFGREDDSPANLEFLPQEVSHAPEERTPAVLRAFDLSKQA